MPTPLRERKTSERACSEARGETMFHAFCDDARRRITVTATGPIVLTDAVPFLDRLPYTRYHEIAAVMRPEEIHPDVRAALDAVVGAFGR